MKPSMPREALVNCGKILVFRKKVKKREKTLVWCFASLLNFQALSFTRSAMSNRIDLCTKFHIILTRIPIRCMEKFAWLISSVILGLISLLGVISTQWSRHLKSISEPAASMEKSLLQTTAFIGISSLSHQRCEFVWKSLCCKRYREDSWVIVNQLTWIRKYWCNY